MIILAQLPVPSFITDNQHLVTISHDWYYDFMTANRIAHFLLPTSEVPAQGACLARRTGSSLTRWLASWTRAVLSASALLTKAIWVGGCDG